MKLYFPFIIAHFEVVGIFGIFWPNCGIFTFIEEHFYELNNIVRIKKIQIFLMSIKIKIGMKML